MAAPNLARFTDDTAPARLSRAIAAMSFANTFTTRAEWRVVNVVPEEISMRS